jgi:hypothetical protein
MKSNLGDNACAICGETRSLDRHHVVPKRMGGSSEPSVHDDGNLLMLCRRCHDKLHQERWRLERSEPGLRVFDVQSGEQVMRRLRDDALDPAALFQLLNIADASLSRLLELLPFVTDEQLVEAFAYAASLEKRAWLVQAAILYEAQKRSIYGEHNLEAIARRFDLSRRQAQKYALVWKQFFAQEEEQQSVNVDAILLQEPSWYTVAATETKDPQKWLEYAQDRKAEDPGYSVTSFRKEIQFAKVVQQPDQAEAVPLSSDPLPALHQKSCPWLRLVCLRSGRAVESANCPCE